MILPELEWLCEEEPRAGAWQMALDEVLLQSAGRPVLRVYRWEVPSVSFGYFGKIEEVERLWPGRAAVRRWTGGGIVPHGAEGEDFTYSVIVPRSHAFARLAPRETYRLLHVAVATSLGSALGNVQFASAAAPKVSGACFENPAEYDVLAGARKVAGAAQRRTRDGMLHQGSIQVAGLGAEFGRRLAGALGWDGVSRLEIPPEAQRAAERLAETRYATEGWLRRA